MKSKNLIRIVHISILKNKCLGLLSIIILCFVQFSYKSQKCNTLLINNVDISKMKVLRVDCNPNKNKNNIHSIKYIGETIDSIKFSILRKDKIIANFLCNPVGVNIDVNNNRYVNDLEELLMISHNGNFLGITIFKNKQQNYFYIPLILNENCY
ncbi:hypothetical protein [Bernardetia sp. MNP-M8]|uniref:hypothetical protein n=1 Tax=Bernardetia sp. MNP-M8 TaxID=3127470 RepID=UPI0030CF7293